MTPKNDYQNNNGWPSRDFIVAAGATGSTGPCAPSVSTRSYRRPSLKELRAMRTPEQKRVTAYHEAGHAAMKFMFGTHYNIVHIDMQIHMRGTFAAAGEIRTADPAEWIPLIAYLPPDVPSDLRSSYILAGKRSMMGYLAGYSAEHRRCPSVYGNWLDEQLDMQGLRWNEDDRHDVHDMARAVRVAKAIRGDNDDAWRLIEQMAAWTDEAFSHPKLWAVVVALAEQLAAVKTRMGGNRVCKIMDNAWNEAGVPCLSMGRKWRRRFSMKVQPALHA